MVRRGLSLEELSPGPFVPECDGLVLLLKLDLAHWVTVPGTESGPQDYFRVFYDFDRHPKKRDAGRTTKILDAHTWIV